MQRCSMQLGVGTAVRLQYCRIRYRYKYLADIRCICGFVQWIIAAMSVVGGDPRATNSGVVIQRRDTGSISEELSSVTQRPVLLPLERGQRLPENITQHAGDLGLPSPVRQYRL